MNWYQDKWFWFGVVLLALSSALIDDTKIFWGIIALLTGISIISNSK